MDSGRWGASYCYTKRDQSQWGAECVACGKNIDILLNCYKIGLISKILLYNNINYVILKQFTVNGKIGLLGRVHLRVELVPEQIGEQSQ